MKSATLKQVKRMLEIFENVSSDKLQRIFALGILSDLRDGDLDEFNRDDFRKLCKLDPIKKNQLEYIDAVEIVPSGYAFVSKENFVIDTSVSARVKISDLGTDFEKNFLDKVENPIGKSTLYYFKLLKRLADDSIIEKLGGKNKVESSLYEMYFLMKQQGHGQAGVLFTNGDANIFYIRDTRGIFWAVDFYWLGDGWGVYARSVDDPLEWYDGDQVFSRNSFVS